MSDIKPVDRVLLPTHRFLVSIFGPPPYRGDTVDMRRFDEARQTERVSAPLQLKQRATSAWVLDLTGAIERRKREAGAQNLEALGKAAGVTGFDLLRVAWLKSVLGPLNEAKFFKDPLVIDEIGDLTAGTEAVKFLESLAAGISAGAASGATVAGIGAAFGAAGGAILATFEYLFGAFERTKQRWIKQLYARAILAAITKYAGPPPASLVLQVAHAAIANGQTSPIKRVRTLYEIARKYSEDYPQTWAAVPALTAQGMQNLLDTVTTRLQRSEGGNLIWGPELVRTPPTNAADVTKQSCARIDVDLTKGFGEESQNAMMTAGAISRYTLYYALESWFPALARIGARGYVTQEQLRSLERTTESVKGGDQARSFLLVNNTSGVFNGRPAVVTVIPELACYQSVFVNLSDKSGLLYGPKET